MRYLFGFMWVLALGSVGCPDDESGGNDYAKCEDAGDTVCSSAVVNDIERCEPSEGWVFDESCSEQDLICAVVQAAGSLMAECVEGSGGTGGAAGTGGFWWHRWHGRKRLLRGGRHPRRAQPDGHAEHRSHGRQLRRVHDGHGGCRCGHQRGDCVAPQRKLGRPCWFWVRVDERKRKRRRHAPRRDHGTAGLSHSRGRAAGRPSESTGLHFVRPRGRQHVRQNQGREQRAGTRDPNVVSRGECDHRVSAAVACTESQSRWSRGVQPLRHHGPNARPAPTVGLQDRNYV